MTHSHTAPLNRLAVLSVHTSPLAPLGSRYAGGMNVYLRELILELDRRGIQVDAFTRGVHQPPFTALPLGQRSRVIYVDMGPGKGLSTDELVSRLPQFSAQVLEHARRIGADYDALFSHYWLSGLAGLCLRGELGRPLYHMFHTLGRVKNRALPPTASPDERASARRIAAEQAIVQEVDGLVASTEQEKRELLTLYQADPAKIAVIPPGVNTAQFHPTDPIQARDRLGLPRSWRIALFVGRIQQIKGIDVLLFAFDRLRRHSETPEGLHLLCLGGDKPGSSRMSREQRRLMELASRLGLDDSVHFLGAKDQSSLRDYYNAADVAVLPSRAESFGLVALEAMACGTPVVASRTGGLPSIVTDGVNGFLCPVGDEECLATRMDRILSNPELREWLGENALERARRQSWPKVSNCIVRLLSGELLADQRRPAAPRDEPCVSRD